MMERLPLSAADILVTRTGTANGTVAVTGTGNSSRTISVSGFSGNGSVAIEIKAGTATDAAGNAAAARKIAAPITVDTVDPLISVRPATKSVVRAGDTASFTVTYTGTEAVTLAAAQITLNKTGTANAQAAVTVNSKTSATVTLSNFTGNGTIGITVPAGSASDLAGNLAPAAPATPAITVDNTPPAVTIAAPVVSADKSPAQIVYAVSYAGADKITLGPTDVDVRTTGTAAATRITVAPGATPNVRLVRLGDFAGSGTVAIRLAANTATDRAGNPADASTADSGSITVGLSGDATTVAISSLAVTAPTGAGASRVDTYIDFTVTTSEIVTVTGAPTLPFKIGGGARTARYAGGSGTSSLLFRYRTTASDNGIVAWDAGSLTGGTVTYWAIATIPVTRTFTAGTSTRSVDTTLPEIPILSHLSQNTSAAFDLTVTRVPTPDTTFKEFRYTTALYQTSVTPPETCAVGTALASGATIPIPAATTSVAVIACDEAGNGSAATTATYTFSWPACAVTKCGNTGNGCYDNTAAMAAGTACLPDDTPVDLVSAAGGFKVWREKNGTRILRATGLWSSHADWQKTLVRNGTAFTTTDFTNVATLAGRACPTNVFIDRDNIAVKNRCMYYDAGVRGALNAARTTGGAVEGEDWLESFTSPNSYGPGADRKKVSRYEGNIKTCADKGMRLPVIYETASTERPWWSNWPSEDGVDVPFDGTGVPHASGDWNWTASGSPVSASGHEFVVFQGTAIDQRGFSASLPVRCVLPSGGTIPSSSSTPIVTIVAPADGSVGLGWVANMGSGSSAVTDFRIEYSSNGGTNWTVYDDGVSTRNFAYVKGLQNGTSYVFRVSAISTAGISPSATTIAGVPTGAALPVCGAPGDGCYDDPGAMAGGKATLSDGREIELVDTGNNFGVWREKGGTRILRSTGLWSSDADWQKTLVRNGTAFTTTDFTAIARIGGRACPPNVFLDRDNMTATDRCRYFDAGNPAQRLDLARGPIDTTIYSNGGGIQGVDWLVDGKFPGTYGQSGDSTKASWYEGNIKTCADKGMRLPVVYETTATGTQWAPGDANPVFGGASGVPSHPAGESWTASARADVGGLWQTWISSSTSIAWFHFTDRYVRCVIPSADAGAPVGVAASGGSSQSGAAAGPRVTIVPPSSFALPLTVGTATVLELNVVYEGATSVNLTDWTRNNVIISTLTGDARAKVSVSGTGTASRKLRLSDFTGNGTLAVAVAANTAMDNAGNMAGAAVLATPITVDTVPPTIAVTAPSAADARAASSIDYTVTYGGASVVNLAPIHVRLVATGGATAKVTISGSGTTTRKVTLSEFKNNGTLGIQILAGSAADAGGNIAPATAIPTTATDPGGLITVDTTPPTMTVAGPSAVTAKGTSVVTYDVNYSGATNITLADSSVSLVKTGDANATVSISVTGTYTRKITLSSFTGNGTIALAVDPGTATDAAGNAAAGASVTTVIKVDTVPPVITVGKPSKSLARTGDTVTYALTLTGATSLAELTAAKVTLNKTGTANVTDVIVNKSVTPSVILFATVTLTGDGTLGITIDAGSATDAAGNPSLASAAGETFTVDNSPPTFVISAPAVSAATPPPKAVFTVTYSGAETITLAPGDVETRTTGTLVADTVAVQTGTVPGTRTVSVSGFSGTGTLAIRLKAGTATDKAGNPAAASTADSQSIQVGLAGGATAVTVSSVALTSPSGAGVSSIDVNLDFLVTTSEIVIVSGAPTLPFKIGGTTRQARYISGSGTTSLVFRYTTGDDNGIVAWDAGSVTGGTITYWADPSTTFTRTFTAGTTTRTIDTTPPDPPVLSEITKSFSEPFNVTVTRVVTPDTTFKEFRYTMAGIDDTITPPADCASGTVLASGGTIAIPRETTKIAVMSCDTAGNSSSTTIGTYTFSWPACAATACGNAGNGCYDNTAAMAAGTACLADNTPIDLVDTGKGFSVWREKYGTRILRATGLWASRQDWQRALNRRGTGFASTFLTDIATIAGRACPIHTFLDPSNLNARDQCLYYTPPQANMSLDSEVATAGRVSGEDYVEDWDSPDSLTPVEDPTQPGWYEGNIKFCADKGMRLPTIYETHPLTTGWTWGNVNDAAPARGNAGIPAGTNNSQIWTASGTNGSDFIYLQFILAPSGGWFKASNSFQVRCVIPSAPPPSALPVAPTAVTVTAGHEAARVAWTRPANTGRPMIQDYVIQYSSNGGTSWTTFPHTPSIKPQIDVTGLLNGASHTFRVAAVNSAGTGPFSGASQSVVVATPTCGTSDQGCYDHAGAMAGGRAKLPGGQAIELVAGANGFSVWREVGGTRILRASGLWASVTDWQKTLIRRGTRFSQSDFTGVAQIAGRVCPANVFLDHDNILATNRCLYYDTGTQTSLWGSGTGIVGEDFLPNWSDPGTAGPLSNPTGPSWYEGNVKSCADKGMRLPTYFEIKGKTQSSPSDGNPVFGGTRVPIPTGRSLMWSASADIYNGAFQGDPVYFMSGAWSARPSHFSEYLRCVIPSEPPPQLVPAAPTELVAYPGKDSVGLRWTAPANSGRPQIFDYQVQYSNDAGQTWTTATRALGAEPRAYVTGLSESSSYLVRVAAVNPVGAGPWVTSTVAVTPTTPTCGAAGAACYDHPGALAGKAALLADGTQIELVPAGGTFSVWKEKNGNRILGATGRWAGSSDWQKKLIRRGNDFAAEDFTGFTTLVGRACPTNVFVSHTNMTTTSNCVYYDAGNGDNRGLWWYALVYPNGVEGEDFITDWNSSSSAGPPSNRALASWYEGNVKSCADKGMRLPTRYELNGGGSVAPTGLDASPVFGGSRVPPVLGWMTWSSSAAGGTSFNSYFYDRHELDRRYASSAVRCVIPASPPATPSQLALAGAARGGGSGDDDPGTLIRINRVIPASPSAVRTPEIDVTAGRAGSVVLYRDGACFTAIGKSEPVAAGRPVKITVKGITPNATTSIYGKVFDRAGESSRCELVTTYRHADFVVDMAAPDMVIAAARDAATGASTVSTSPAGASATETIYEQLGGFCLAPDAVARAPWSRTTGVTVAGLVGGGSGVTVRLVASGGGMAAPREIARKQIRVNSTIHFGHCDPRYNYAFEVTAHPAGGAAGQVIQTCHLVADGQGVANGNIKCVDVNIASSRMGIALGSGGSAADFCVTMSYSDSGNHFRKSMSEDGKFTMRALTSGNVYVHAQGDGSCGPAPYSVTITHRGGESTYDGVTSMDPDSGPLVITGVAAGDEFEVRMDNLTGAACVKPASMPVLRSSDVMRSVISGACQGR
jgi:hypothetical protein